MALPRGALVTTQSVVHKEAAAGGKGSKAGRAWRVWKSVCLEWKTWVEGRVEGDEFREAESLLSACPQRGSQPYPESKTAGGRRHQRILRSGSRACLEKLSFEKHRFIKKKKKLVWVYVGSIPLTFQAALHTWKCGTYTPGSLWMGSK